MLKVLVSLLCLFPLETNANLRAFSHLITSEFDLNSFTTLVGLNVGLPASSVEVNRVYTVAGGSVIDFTFDVTDIQILDAKTQILKYKVESSDIGLQPLQLAIVESSTIPLPSNTETYTKIPRHWFPWWSILLLFLLVALVFCIIFICALMRQKQTQIGWHSLSEKDTEEKKEMVEQCVGTEPTNVVNEATNPPTPTLLVEALAYTTGAISPPTPPCLVLEPVPPCQQVKHSNKDAVDAERAIRRQLQTQENWARNHLLQQLSEAKWELGHKYQLLHAQQHSTLFQLEFSTRCCLLKDQERNFQQILRASIVCQLPPAEMQPRQEIIHEWETSWLALLLQSTCEHNQLCLLASELMERRVFVAAEENFMALLQKNHKIGRLQVIQQQYQVEQSLDRKDLIIQEENEWQGLMLFWQIGVLEENEHIQRDQLEKQAIDRGESLLMETLDLTDVLAATRQKHMKPQKFIINTKPLNPPAAAVYPVHNTAADVQQVYLSKSSPSKLVLEDRNALAESWSPLSVRTAKPKGTRSPRATDSQPKKLPSLSY